MARNMYIYFPSGKTDVRLKGGGGRNGKSVLYSYSFSTSIPLAGANSGLVTGRRMHQPFTIRKEVDSASPKLFQALRSEDPLNCQINVYKPGYPRPSYSLSLFGGELKGIRHGTASGHEYEDITFVFEKIEVTWNDGGISALDDWNAAA